MQKNMNRVKVKIFFRNICKNNLKLFTEFVKKCICICKNIVTTIYMIYIPLFIEF